MHTPLYLKQLFYSTKLVSASSRASTTAGKEAARFGPAQSPGKFKLFFAATRARLLLELYITFNNSRILFPAFLTYALII